MKLILRLVTKLIGVLWVYACIPFRAYARSVVYNYVLKNNKTNWLRRLWERSPKYTQGYSNDVEGRVKLNGWILKDIHQVGYNGFVAERKKPVSKLWFYVVAILIYGFLDDDSNHDTTDLGYCYDLSYGWRKDEWTAKLFGWALKKINYDSVERGLGTNTGLETIRFGNAFDLGDYRGSAPFFNGWCTWVWNTRNPAMNFQYLWLDY